MKRKAIRCLLILSFLTIFGLLFYAEITWCSPEVEQNITKTEDNKKLLTEGEYLHEKIVQNTMRIKELEGKVQNNEQNKKFYEVVFHQQNTFLTVVVSALGIILLALIGTQILFSFKISKDIIDRAVDKAKKDMIKTIGDTRAKLEEDIENSKTKLSKLEEIVKKETNELTGLVCHNEGVYHYQVGDYTYAIKRLEAAIDCTKRTSNKKASLFWIARSLQRSDKEHYPENLRKRVKEKPEIYSGLEKEIEEAIESAV